MAEQVVVVIGMHRSGTSAGTRGLKALGIELGQSLVPPGEGNPRGFWENSEIVSLNTRVLAALGLTWDSLFLVPPSRWRDEAVQKLQASAAATVEKYVQSYRRWGFKDPRTLRVLPFWIEVFAHLALTPAYVLVIRNPLSVAQSLFRRDRFDPLKSCRLWSLHLVPYLSRIQERLRVVVDYDLLMGDPVQQLNRIASRLGLPATAQVRAEMEAYAGTFLSVHLRHSLYSEDQIQNDPCLDDLGRTAWRLLLQLARDQVVPGSEEFRQSWAALEARFWLEYPLASNETPPLAHQPFRQQSAPPAGGALPYLAGRALAGMPRDATGAGVIQRRKIR